MMSCGYGMLVFLTILLSSTARSHQKLTKSLPYKITKFNEDDGEINSKTSAITGKRWAVLVAGSNGYANYRHQADVCHAYQILKKGGLKDENIIVFMYDDIAFNTDNPRPGIIINKPQGSDVYQGVPKDYTGDSVTVENLFAVLLGNKSAVKGGSGKVLDSGSNDSVFIYYADHGSPGLVGMPSGDYLYAKDLIEVLKKMHLAKAYKSLVFYLEACESGSMFEGVLPSNLNIYAVTAANADESSYGTYCPGGHPSPPSEYETCLGDLFSISWLEDSELHDLSKETLGQQYHVVRRRTGFDVENESSHVMQYGDMKLRKDYAFVYMGTNPENENFTLVAQLDSNSNSTKTVHPTQRDATFLHFWRKFQKASEGSKEKVEAHKKIVELISRENHVDGSIKHIATTLFGDQNGSQILDLVRPVGHPLVDDWDCLKSLVKAYEEQCGSVSWYGRKYSRALANMCNAGVNVEQLRAAAAQACPSENIPSFSYP